ncbi:COP9 signalosome catalytic subunit rri1 [Agyrium rufum]|nr:COP9 signalosome catalytic subunit rri1 [Agyrium rufum]
MESMRSAWEIENAVKLVDPHRDALYSYDAEEQKAINSAAPWKKDPHYFKHVRISAVALLKMVMHARSGGSIEIMGLMQGKIAEDTFIVTDAFRLPVEGTETRVNAGAEADEYQVNYLQMCRDNGRADNAIGWYHSHPGYGCWLSGIDVGTERIQQTFFDPYLAIVIDPDRTISAGKVEIGAFRTYPDNYKPAGAQEDDEYQSIPLAKIEDFGAHADQYYSLDISHFKSTLDTQLLESLWNKYWVSTLSQSPLSTNRDYGTKRMLDLSQKIQNAKKSVQGESRRGYRQGATAQQESSVDKVIRDGEKIKAEERNGLLATEIMAKLFNGVGARA